MRITFDPTKRQRTLEERGLNFEDAKVVFQKHLACYFEIEPEEG